MLSLASYAVKPRMMFTGLLGNVSFRKTGECLRVVFYHSKSPKGVGDEPVLNLKARPADTIDRRIKKGFRFKFLDKR